MGVSSSAGRTTRAARAALVALLSASAACAAPDAAPNTGWVEGVIKAAPKAGAPAAAAANASYGDRAFRDAVLFNYDRPGRFVVYLVPAGVDEPLPVPGTAEAVLSAERGVLRLEPSFFVVPLGAELLLRNADASEHNVFSTGLSAKFINAAVPAKGTHKVRCNRLGPVFLRSLDASAFNASFFIASALWAVSDEEGRYRVQAPAGAYRIEVWHPRLPPESRGVTVPVGGAVKADFVLSVNSLQEAP